MHFLSAVQTLGMIEPNAADEVAQSNCGALQQVVVIYDCEDIGNNC